MEGHEGMENTILYCEWFPLPKAEFRIMAMLAEQGGTYSGNLSDMCRYFSVTPQSRNRAQLQTAIESLTSKGFLAATKLGRTYHLKLIPKEKEIALSHEWVKRLIARDYSSESVSWEAVLKVLLWIIQNKQPIVTNAMLAAALNLSPSTIGSAKNVLEREYEAITRKRVSEKLGDNFFQVIGQELAASAWWKDE